MQPTSDKSKLSDAQLRSAVEDVSMEDMSIAKPPKPRKVACRVKLASVTLKLTLTAKFLAKPLREAVLIPFLGAYNKKTGLSLDVSGLHKVTVDGSVVAHENSTVTCEILFVDDDHEVEIFVSADADKSPVDVSDGGGGSASPASPVERVLAAAHEFEVLELPTAAASQTAVGKAYRKVSLSVHPDKVTHPKASEAFRRTFEAMQMLMDSSKQARRLREIETGSSSSSPSKAADALPTETHWWAHSSVKEMEQAFRNLEEYLEAQGAFGVDAIEDNMWLEAHDAERLRMRKFIIFIDARDVGDFGVSHVADALSLPGHTMEQLEKLGDHPTLHALKKAPAAIAVVYSDNGSKLSRCVHVSQYLRRVLLPERVRRLRGGLNGWKRMGLPVDGDTRQMFAGKALDRAAITDTLGEGGMLSMRSTARHWE